MLVAKQLMELDTSFAVAFERAVLAAHQLGFAPIDNVLILEVRQHVLFGRTGVGALGTFHD